MPQKQEDEIRRLKRWLTAIADSPKDCGTEMQLDAKRALSGENFPLEHPLAARVHELHGTGGR